MGSIELYPKLLISNVKHHLLYHMLIGAGIVLVTPFLFGMVELGQKAAAAPLEQIMSLLGIVLLTPIVAPEQLEEIRDVVMTKKMSYLVVCVIRVLISIVVLCCFIGILMLYMRVNACEVTMSMYGGTIANGLFLGGLGFFAAVCFDNIIGGYMVTMMYYALNYGIGKKLDIYSLFAMMAGKTSGKPVLAGIGVVFILSALLVIRLSEKHYLKR